MIHPISCVVLAGGKGTRALATGTRTPKVLRSVGSGESLLYNAITRALAVAAEVLVAVGPLRELLSMSLPVSSRIRIVDDFGIGNGRALVSASFYASYEHIMVMNADTVNDVPYSLFIDKHLARASGGSILLTRCEEVQNPGAYLVRNDGLVIHSFEAGNDIEDTHHSLFQYWRGASTGVLIYPTRELATVSIIEKAVVEKDITPSFITRHALWAYDAGHALTLDLGVPLRIACANQLPRSAYLRRD